MKLSFLCRQKVALASRGNDPDFSLQGRRAVYGHLRAAIKHYCETCSELIAIFARRLTHSCSRVTSHEFTTAPHQPSHSRAATCWPSTQSRLSRGGEGDRRGYCTDIVAKSKLVTLYGALNKGDPTDLRICCSARGDPGCGDL